MEDLWPSIIGTITNGIYVLTAGYKDGISGMIVSWVSQASYDPPLIMAAVHPNRYCHDLIKQSGCFALHILSRSQSDLVQRFSAPDSREKFKNIPWRKGEIGCPVLESCIARVECHVVESYHPGNHTLFIGQVRAVHVFSAETPLSTLDFQGTYLGKS